MKKILKGIGVSPGIVSGKVKIINNKKPTNFSVGDILVTKITDPTMTFLMVKAGAIVCEIGGMTSHPSIVSREMGIPCIVSVKGVTKKLKDNQLVSIDGKKGEITYET